MPVPINLPPTAVDLRARIPAQFLTRLGFPPSVQGVADPMDSFCQTAVAYVANTTGREVDSTLAVQQINPQAWNWISGYPDTGSYGSTLDLGPIGFRAVILRAVQEATHESTDYMQVTVGEDYLSKFKAGSYSEERNPSETVLRGRGSSVSNPQINPWRELSDLLWLLCTGDQFSYWQMRLGSPMPASVTVEQDWTDTWNAPAGAGSMPGFGSPGIAGSWGGDSSGGGWNE